MKGIKNWIGRHVGLKWIVKVFGENRKERRKIRRKTLNRIQRDFYAPKGRNKFARHLQPAAVSKALQKHIKAEKAIAKLRKNGKTSLEARVASAILGARA